MGTRVTVPKEEMETIDIALQQEEARIEYEQTVKQAEATLAKLRADPSQYTVDGKRVTGSTIDRLQRELDQYKKDYLMNQKYGALTLNDLQEEEGWEEG